MVTRVVTELRQKRPALALQADHENSRRAAIHLFCLECVGGQRGLAVDCDTYECPLWPFRPGDGNKVRPAGVVPTPEEYEKLCVDKLGDRAGALKERGAKLASARKDRRAGEPDPFEGLEEDEEEDEPDPFEE